MKKEELLYCIFIVYDYKGGELSSELNLSFSKFISTLAGYYKGDEEVCNIKDDLPTLKAYIKDNPMEFDEYAGGGGTVVDYYAIKNGKLSHVDPNEYTTDIAKHINANWR